MTFRQDSVDSMDGITTEPGFLFLHVQTDFFVSDVLGVINSRKKFDRESSSEVHKMLGCLKSKYENCIFIC